MKCSQPLGCCAFIFTVRLASHPFIRLLLQATFTVYRKKFIEIFGRDNRVWHSSCKTTCSVISFSVINYVVSMRCPRGSDDSSFFLQKNELGLEESGTFQPQSAEPTAPVRGMRPPLRFGRRLRSTYRIMVKTVSSRVLEASLIVPPLRRSIWRERLRPTPVPALPLVVKNGTKSCS